jgi:transcriptional regulator GlxA family with amidase domain
MTSPVAAQHIGILLFDDVEELDAVGPYEVLAWWARRHPEDGYAVSCFSADGAPVTAAKGLVLGAHYSFADVPPLAVLVHPGGAGTRALMRDPEHLEWVRRTRSRPPSGDDHDAFSVTRGRPAGVSRRERHDHLESGVLMTSVCTGSLVYAAAGLLSGRPATTHWAAFDELLAADPSIEPRPDDRYVDDGDVITSAGVSAGIDMALHLVRRLAGAERAREVTRGIQYDPHPPV